MFFGWHTRDIGKSVCKYVFVEALERIHPNLFGQFFLWKPNLPNIGLQNMVSFILAIFFGKNPKNSGTCSGIFCSLLHWLHPGKTSDAQHCPTMIGVRGT